MTTSRRPAAGERLRIRIDRSLPDPPFAQLVSQIRTAVERGSLEPGARLPTVRALARRTGLVPNTVAKAYRELEAAGVLEGRGRAGTFVLAPRRPSGDAPGDALDAAARAYLDRARELGAGRSAAIEALRSVDRP
jgi:DNA-binding transcriptional regulator YhcF (GntR family)